MSEKRRTLLIVEDDPALQKQMRWAFDQYETVVANNREEAIAQFDTSLKQTGAGYFDFYLLHALQTENYKKYDEYKVWEFAKELKEKGLIRHYGFSFHAGPGLLDELLTKHPDVDFIQLQINYIDMENPNLDFIPLE